MSQAALAQKSHELRPAKCPGAGSHINWVRRSGRPRDLRVEIVRKVEGGTEKFDPIPPDNTLQLLQDETPRVRVVYDASSGKAAITKITVTTDSPSVVGVAPGDPPTLNARNTSDKPATLTVQIDGEPEPRAALGFKAKVLGTIASIVVENGQALSLPEGDSVSLRLKITGPNGETYKLSERPDIQIVSLPKGQGLVSYSIDKDTVTLTAQAVTTSKTTSQTQQVSADHFRTTIDTIANTPTSGAPQTATFRFKTPYGVGGETTSEPLTVSVTEKFGYITFEPPPRGFLLPGGTFTTTAIVRRKTGEIIYGQGVEYSLENETDNSKWVTLAPEGNKVNVYWAEPADPAQGRDRPAQVRINVTAHPVGGGVITGKIFVRMGEVTKFAPLKVKVNVMDQRTANDLYGEVMSDEYYVLTVRLFNNLRDQETNELTGASILAYSSSIEMAVGMEKKFDNDSDTDFPNVIGKDAARRISQRRNAAAEKTAEEQAKADILAAESAHQALLDATATQHDEEQKVGHQKELAFRKVKDAEDKRDAAWRLNRRAEAAHADADRLREQAALRRNRATELAQMLRRARETRTSAGDDPDLLSAARRAESEAAEAERKADTAVRQEVAADKAAHTAQRDWEQAADEARVAVRAANAQVDTVGRAYDNAARARASIARANELRTPVSQALAMKSDPDTAYDDGRWHAVTPGDFVRITKPTEEKDFRQGLYTEKIPESVLTNLNGHEEPAAVKGKSGNDGEPADRAPVREAEPVCNSVTTYRPFTFEMMVNTVDRRDGRSRRTLAFKILEGLGTAASFVTAIAVPPPGNDLPLGLEKYRNLFIPGADRLFPSLKEQQR